MEETLPYSWYVDPEILRSEQERIFRSAWQYAGPHRRGAGARKRSSRRRPDARRWSSRAGPATASYAAS